MRLLSVILLALASYTLAQSIPASITLNARVAQATAADGGVSCGESFEICLGSYPPCEGDDVQPCWCTSIASKIGCFSTYCPQEYSLSDQMAPFFASSSSLCAGVHTGGSGTFLTTAAASVATAATGKSTAAGGAGAVATTTTSKGAAQAGFAQDKLPVAVNGVLAGVVGLVGLVL